MLRLNKGFTLIEIMIVVVVLGILAAIAYPSYGEYVKRANRTEGQALLNDAAARQERFYAQNYKYATTISALYGGSATTKKSETGKYTLALSTAGGDGGYTLTANAQFTDPKCGNLALNALGKKSKTGSKDLDYCWR